MYRHQSTLDQDDSRLDLFTSSTSSVIELDSDASGNQHTYHQHWVMSPHYIDTASIHEGLVTTQEQQQDDVTSTDEPNEKPRKSSGTYKGYVDSLFCCSYIACTKIT